MCGAIDVGLVGASCPPAFHRHLHIGLAGCKPHFAYQYILYRNGLAVADGDAMLLETAFGSIDLQGPISPGIRACAVDALCPGRTDFNRDARLCLPPYRCLAVLLEYHIVGKQRRKADLRFCAHGKQPRCQDEEEFFHIKGVTKQLNSQKYE